MRDLPAVACGKRPLSPSARCGPRSFASFLTLLGVMAGVATVIMMVSFVVGFNNQVVSRVHRVRHLPRPVPEIRAAVRRPGERPRGAAQPPRPHPGGRLRPEATVEARRPPCPRSATCSATCPCAPAGARGQRAGAPRRVTPTTAEANTHFVDDGRFLTDADLHHAAHVCVIGADVADALCPHRDPIGQELTVEGPGLPGHRASSRTRESGLFGGKQRQLRGASDHHLRRASSRR